MSAYVPSMGRAAYGASPAAAGDDGATTPFAGAGSPTAMAVEPIHTPNTEDARSPRSLCDEDLNYVDSIGVTAPLITITADGAARHHRTAASAQSLSPLQNGTLGVPPPQHSSNNNLSSHYVYHGCPPSYMTGTTPEGSSFASMTAVSPLPPQGENISFTSVVAGQQPHNHYAAVAEDTPAVAAPPTVPVQNTPPPPSLFRRAVSVILPSLRAFRQRVQHMTWKQLLWVVFLVVLVMVGNFMQIVMLNFWLISFPSGGTPGNYTAFAVPGIFFAVLFVLLFGAYAVIRRPSLQFAKHLHGWGILIGVGFCDAFNSWMATYAASYTSEVLQALFTNMCPLYAVLLCKWILHDTRRYANIYIATVFVLTVLGILAASLYGLVMGHNMGEGKWWILIFFLSMPLRVLMNVWQSLYMIVYTQDPNFVSWLRVRLAKEDEPASPSVLEGAGEVPAITETKKDPSCHGEVDVVDLQCATPVDSLEGDDTPQISSHQFPKTTKPHQRALAADGQSAPHTAAAEKADEEEDGVDDDDTVAVKKKAMLYLDTGLVDECHHSPTAASPVSMNNEPIASRDPAEVAADEDEGLPPAANGDEEEDRTPTGTGAPPLPTETMFTVRYNQGEDTVVKLVMLAGETFAQMCFTLSLLPADALPWWGNSDTVAATWDNFLEGIRCVFTIQENFLYCFLYTLGFVFTYIGCAYLNHYSAALCSIVSQLSSPVTALMLVIVPAWNVQEDGDSPWYCNVIAIVLLSIAALVYVMWEEMTDHEKVQAEYELKMQQLHVRPSTHDTPHSVTIAE